MKHLSSLLGLLLALTLSSPVLADSTTSGLNSGGTVQTQDQFMVYRPSNPGTNFKVTIGSAGTQSIGTSGATVPLLSTANTWSGLQSFLSGDLTAADPVFTGGSLLLPAGATSQRPGSPVNGMLRYNSTTPGVEGYVNGAWGPLGGTSSSGITALTGVVTASGAGSVATTFGTFPSSTLAAAISDETGSGLAVFGTSPTISGATITGTINGVTPTTTGSATTFLNGAGGYTTPATNGGVTTFNARAGAVVPASGDYTVSQVTGAAPLASPTFTGTVTTPLSAAGVVTTNGSGVLASVAVTPLANGGTGSTNGTINGNTFYDANIDAAKLPNLRGCIASLSGAGSGAGKNCLLFFQGTSLTSGVLNGANDAPTLSPPSQFTAMLNASGIPASANSWLGGWTSSYPRETYDKRIVKGSDWSRSTYTSAGGNAFTASSGGSNPLSFTPGWVDTSGNLTKVSVDTCSILYVKYPTAASFSYNFDGGTAITVSTNATDGLGVVTASTNLANHTLNVNWVSGTGPIIIGEYCYNSAIPQVIVLNGGWPGSTVANWIVTNETGANDPWAPGNFVASLSPSLAWVELGANEEIQATSTSTFLTNLNTAKTQAANSGNTDVLLQSYNWFNPATYANHAAYVSQIAAAAGTTIPYVDVSGRFGSYAAETAANTNYINTSDGFTGAHLNAAGQHEEAEGWASAISPVIGIAGGGISTKGANANAATSVQSVATGGTGATQTGNASIQNLMGGLAQLPHWNQALARVLSGTGNAKILCFGTSISEGYYSTGSASTAPLSANTSNQSFCGQISQMFNAHGVYSNYQAFVGDGLGDRRTLQSQLVIPGAWTPSTLPGLGGYLVYNATSQPGTATYTPSIPVDTFKLGYIKLASGLGSFSYSVDGGSATTISETGTAGLYFVTVPAGSLGSHTLNLTQVSGQFFFDTLEGWDSTKPQVIVENAGWASSHTDQYITAINGLTPSTMCGQYGADLVIIEGAVNDFTASLTPTQTTSNLKTLATACQSGGSTDVMFVTDNHIDPNGGSSFSEAAQATYAAAVKAAAAQTSNSPYVAGVPVADEFANMVSYSFQVNELSSVTTPGSFPADVHPDAIGHAIYARDIFSVLLPGGNAKGSYLSGLTMTGPLQVYGYTVATLPTGKPGMTAYVTDATSCTLNGTLTGSGSTFCPVIYNGSAWVGG